MDVYVEKDLKVMNVLIMLLHALKIKHSVISKEYAIQLMVANVILVFQEMIVSLNNLHVSQILLHVLETVPVQKKRDASVSLVSLVKNVIFLNLIVLTLDLIVLKEDSVWSGMENVDVLDYFQVMNVKLPNLDV